MGDENRIDWNRIVERVTWAAVTIASLLWGGSQQIGRMTDQEMLERLAGKLDVVRGEGIEWGRDKAYYEGVDEERATEEP